MQASQDNIVGIAIQDWLHLASPTMGFANFNSSADCKLGELLTTRHEIGKILVSLIVAEIKIKQMIVEVIRKGDLRNATRNCLPAHLGHWYLAIIAVVG